MREGRFTTLRLRSGQAPTRRAQRRLGQNQWEVGIREFTVGGICPDIPAEDFSPIGGYSVRLAAGNWIAGRSDRAKRYSPTANATIVCPRRPVVCSNCSSNDRLHSFGVNLHLAGGNLLIAGAVVAEFANAKAVFGSHRRSKDAAGHGTSCVQVAGPSQRIEYRTWFVVGEVFESRRGRLRSRPECRSQDRRENRARGGRSTRGRVRECAPPVQDRSTPDRPVLAVSEVHRAG